eukprot:4077789-Prymnesium_polylepis.1
MSGNVRPSAAAARSAGLVELAGADAPCPDHSWHAPCPDHLWHAPCPDHLWRPRVQVEPAVSKLASSTFWSPLSTRTIRATAGPRPDAQIWLRPPVESSSPYLSTACRLCVAASCSPAVNAHCVQPA